MTPAAQRAVAAFRDRFGRESTVVARAPGRVNLIGEHLDYNGGFVLPMAIERDCVVAGALSLEQMVRIIALDTVSGMSEEWVWCLDGPGKTAERDQGAVATRMPKPADVQRGHWTSYAVGLIVQVAVARCDDLKAVTIPPMDLVIATDVPLGSGLSSSASLEVSLARAVVAISDWTWEPLSMARACQQAEHKYAGVPCGIMDQLASAAARAGHAMRIDCGRTHGIEHVPMPPASEAVVAIMDTGVRHTLASGEFARRVQTTRNAADIIGVDALAAAGHRDVEAARERLTEEELRCARHVVSEQERTRQAASALRAGDAAEFGRLMNASHDSLRDDYRVSCPELDTIVEAARSVPGVFGARMTGGGFGGCAIALLRPGALEDLTHAVQLAYAGKHRRRATIFTSAAVEGATLIPPTAV